jgi:hypothetical protein
MTLFRWDVKGAGARVEKGLQSEEEPGPPEGYPTRQLVGGCYLPSISLMADEDTVLEEAMDNLKEAGQRIRATQSLMRSQGMTDGEN